LPTWPKLDVTAPSILAIGEPTARAPLLPPAIFAAMQEFLAKGGRPAIF
jgi:hypothetical protein